MGFSILIPVYNTDITQLVHQLHQQALGINEPFEILLLDDRSELKVSYINKKVNLLSQVDYIVLTENIGRASIRNQLFARAQYEKCIVLDGDMAVIDVQFLQNYLTQLQEKEVLVGGHVYTEQAPSFEEYNLHWRYGSELEVQPASARNKEPYSRFMTGNFAIFKQDFLLVQFDESIKGYGHEDTLFGINLKKQQIRVKHIDNPLLHNGLETNEVFLSKQKTAVSNLKQIYANKQYSASLKKHIRLIAAAKNPFVRITARILQPIIERNLNSKQPNLKMLQLQKVNWWHDAH